VRRIGRARLGQGHDPGGDDERELGQPERTDPDHLPGQEFTGAHPGQQDLGDAGLLLLHDSGQHGVAVQAHGQQDEHHGNKADLRRVLGLAGVTAELPAGQRHRCQQPGDILHRQAKLGGTVADPRGLHGVRDQRLQAGVGLSPPFRRCAVDEQDVHRLVAHRLLPRRHRVVRGGGHLHVGGTGLRGQRVGQARRDHTGQADTIGPGVIREHRRYDDDRHDRDEGEDRREQEGAGAAPLHHLPGRDGPGTP
jgi:hypothetical protein